MMSEFNFEKLEVWQKAKSLVTEVYRVCSKFPKTETYGLTNQLQRAIISVPSNIAEGNSRFSPRERIHFIEISYGSLMEAYCQVAVAVDLGYLSNEDFEILKPAFQEVGKMLSGLRSSLLKKV